LSVDAVHAILTEVEVTFDDERLVGVDGGVVSEPPPALVVADACCDCAETLFAASYAATVYVYVVLAASPVSG
jgi:hypothetical protein